MATLSKKRSKTMKLPLGIHKHSLPTSITAIGTLFPEWQFRPKMGFASGLLLLVLALLFSSISSADAFDGRLKKAYALALLHETVEAKQDLEQILAENGTSVVAWNNIGTMHFRLGDYEKAVQAYEKAVDLAPRLSVPRYNLANTLALLSRLQGLNNEANATNTNESAEEYRSQAIDEYEQVLVLHPDFVEAYNNLALLFAIEQDTLKKALSLLDEALLAARKQEGEACCEKLAWLHFNRGRLLHELGAATYKHSCSKHRSPEKRLYASVGLPSDLECLNQEKERITGIWADQISACGEDWKCKRERVQQWRQALAELTAVSPVGQIEEYTHALTYDPHLTEALVNRGTAHVGLEAEDKALRDYRQAIRRRPYLLSAHNNLGSLLFSTDRATEGEAQYELVSHLRTKLFQGGGEGTGKFAAQRFRLGQRWGRVTEPWMEIQSLTMSFLTHVQPEGYPYSVPVVYLIHAPRPFAQKLMPPSLETHPGPGLDYTILPAERYESPDNSLLTPAVRVLSVFNQAPDLRRHPQIGTGILVERRAGEGYIVTAYHNLYRKDRRLRKGDFEASEVFVQFFTPNPQVRRAEIVWKNLWDTGLDLAIVRVENLPDTLPIASLGTTLQLQRGDQLHIVGQPEDTRWALGHGEFLAADPSAGTFCFLSVDVVPGYSGGPVYLARTGQVVGMLIEKPSAGERTGLSAETLKTVLERFLYRFVEVKP